MVLKNVKNPYFWHVTNWPNRLIIGLTGFIINILIAMTYNTIFFNLVSNYTIIAFLTLMSGYICYGIIPILFDKLGMLNSERSEDLVRKKYLQMNRNK